ncbi:MAG TPA: ABC transporter permease subunit [Gemmataceae bacterium]|nr:ABC transporter permease subunit [Gemmataceae bacterium]
MIGLGILGGTGGAFWYGRHLLLAQQILLGSLLLLGAALLLRLAGISLIGPVFAYDVVRSARRGRQVIARSAYGGIVLAALLCAYSLWFGDTIHAFRDLFAQAALPANALARFASVFFGAFVAIQLLATLALTPAYTAGVIAQEKQRGTLDALLATALDSREIVAGLLLSRLANLASLIITGLPILSLMILWGGIDPELVLAVFVGTGLTMISLAGLSLLQSVYATRPRDAVLRTYLFIFAFLVLTGFLEVALVWAGRLGWNPVLDHTLIPGDVPVTFRDGLEGLCIANPFVFILQLRQGAGGSVSLTLLTWYHLRDYGLFHLLVAIICIALAVLRIRSVAQRQAGRKTTEPIDIQVRRRKRRIRPGRGHRVAGRGMLWKETVVEARPGRGALGWLWLGVRVTVLFWLAIHICFHLGRWIPTGPNDELVQLTNVWVRLVTVVMGGFMLLGVAIRAAGSVSGERDRQTLDGLLVTPLPNRTLLFAKWLGSILSMRGAWLRLGVVWGIGIVLGALHPLAVGCLVLVWFLYAAVSSSVGLWASVVTPSAHRAMISTVLLVLGAILVPLVVVHFWLGLGDPPAEMLALMPLHLLSGLAFSKQEYTQAAGILAKLWTLGIPLGLWALAAAGLYLLAGYRFRALTGRDTSGGDTSADLQVSSAPACGAPAEEEVLIVRRRVSWSLRLRNAGLLVLPLVLLLACYGYLDDAANRDLQEAIALADSLDPHWRLEEIEANRVKIPDDRNSARLVQKLKNVRDTPWYTEETDRIIQNQSPELQLEPQETVAIRNLLAAAQPALIEARRLSEMPTGNLPVAWSRDGWSTPLPHVQDARLPVNLLTLDVLLRAQEEDAEGALASCMAILNTGRSLGDTPLLIPVMVRTAIVEAALVQIERTLAQGRPSEAALAAVQHLLEDEDRQPLLLVGLRGERACCNQFFEALRSGDAQAEQIFDMNRRMNLDMLLPSYLRSLKSEEAEVLRQHTQLVEAAKLPVEQQEARFLQIGTVLQRSLAGWFFPRVAPVLASDRLMHAQLRSTLTALAAERYRCTHGDWPTGLTALVPEYLVDVPLDPYDGQPLRYSRLADGVVVYSVGPDGTDNGGKLDRKFPSRPGTDRGMRLWNPAKRRQFPPQVPSNTSPKPE